MSLHSPSPWTQISSAINPLCNCKRNPVWVVSFLLLPVYRCESQRRNIMNPVPPSFKEVCSIVVLPNYLCIMYPFLVSKSVLVSGLLCEWVGDWTGSSTEKSMIYKNEREVCFVFSFFYKYTKIIEIHFFYIKLFWNFSFVADTTSALLILNKLTNLKKIRSVWDE